MSGTDASVELIGGDAANGLDVDVTRVSGTVAVSNAGLTELAAAIDTEVQCDIVGALPAGNNNIGDIDVASIAAGDNNIGNVDVASIAAGDNNIGNVDIVSLPASTNTLEVVGDAAHGAAVAGNPLLVGLEGRSTDGTAVDSGDVVRALATLLGKPVNYPHALPGSTWSYASPAAVTDTSDDEAKAATASTIHYITSIQVFNADDTVGTEVVIKDGSTVKWRGWCEQTGGGCSAVFPVPLRGTANTAINVANVTTSAETYFNLQGFSATE